MKRCGAKGEIRWNKQTPLHSCHPSKIPRELKTKVEGKTFVYLRGRLWKEQHLVISVERGGKHRTVL